MKTALQSIARFRIHAGKLDEFNLLASECIEVVKEKDTGTLQYDWFYNQDNTECVVIERYKDSDALLEHMANLGDILGRAMAISDFSADVYGNPSQTLLDATTGLDIRVFSYFAGLESAAM